MASSRERENIGLWCNFNIELCGDNGNFKDHGISRMFNLFLCLFVFLFILETLQKENDSLKLSTYEFRKCWESQRAFIEIFQNFCFLQLGVTFAEIQAQDFIVNVEKLQRRQCSASVSSRLKLW